MGRYGLLVVLSLATAFGYACGDDDDDSAIGDGGLDGGEAGFGGSRAGSGGSGAGSGGTSVSTAGAGGSSVSGSGGTGQAGSAAAGTGGTMAPSVECGNETCAAPSGPAANMGVSACCTDDDACGLMNPLTGQCLEMGITGGADPSCPNLSLGAVAGGGTLSGCCTPEGECGAQFGAGAGGCIANGQLMSAEQSCDPDPNNTCTRIVDVACDGSEDCSNGQQCCGVYQGGYRSFQCADDCAASEDAEPGSTWSEACHPGDECSDATLSCRQNLMFLPDFLFRCRIDGDTPERTDGSRAAGEVNCGNYVCGQGQKCCLSVPGEAVCVDENSTCGCTPEGSIEDGGVEDAGH